MKKIYVFLIALFFAPSMYATHLMGGEITLRQISALDYEITLTAYRDTLGVPMRLTGQFNVYDTSGLVMSLSIPVDTTSGNLQLSIPYGIEIYVFKDTIQFPREGFYYIGYSDCCRNGAILNLGAPLSENMYLHTTVKVDTVAGNSSPYFMAAPTTHLPALTSWQYNPLPTDPDGDSLAWSIDVPLRAAPVGTVSSPVASYSAPFSTLSNPFSIDPVTGQISWTASTIGNFAASILVEEFRGGAKIGEIRRDMQFIVAPISSASAPPKFVNFAGSFPPNSSGYPSLTAGIGKSNLTQMNIRGIDPNSPVKFEAFGEPFLFKANQAVFTSRTLSSPNHVEGYFDWIPVQSQARAKPYIIVFRASDGRFAMDQTVLVEVKNVTGLEREDYVFTKLYPNPTEGMVYMPLKMNKAQNVTIEVYDVLGSKVLEFKDRLGEGNQVLAKEMRLPGGQYYIRISGTTGLLGVQKLMVK